MSTSATEQAWTAAAFGLTISGDQPTPGLSDGAATASTGAPVVALRPAPRRELDAGWPKRGVRRLSSVRIDGATRAVMTIEAHPDGGYRFTGVGYGRFVVPPAADEVRFAPAGPGGVRYLHGQVLPFVAGLHGRELLHAGSVVTDRGAIAVSGPSGAGKTTLTRALVDAGARFLSDDVVALTCADDATVVAHPGPAMSVVVDAQGGERFAGVAAIAPAAPLHAICLLRRGDARKITLETLPPEDPRPLLTAGYDAVRRDPARLISQLDVLAAVAAQARLLLVRAPTRATPQELAAALLAELS